LFDYKVGMAIYPHVTGRNASIIPISFPI